MNFAADSETTATVVRAQPEELAYRVAGMSCGHCEAAVREEVGRVPGVRSVAVDLERKLVHVAGAGLDDAALRAAIGEAGYEADLA